jgi:hypothetical protein
MKKDLVALEGNKMPKEGQLVKYQVNLQGMSPFIGIFIGSFTETRGETQEVVEFHEVFVFETGCLETFFAFELEEVVNE